MWVGRGHALRLTVARRTAALRPGDPCDHWRVGSRRERHVAVLTVQDYLRRAWWLITFPGAMVTMVTLAFSMLGESLSEILNPRLAEL